jgi:hypothetical protein
VLATLTEQDLNVTVRDEGRGITPRPDSPGLGLGLPLIASLADSVQLGRDEQERTEVQMIFTLGEDLVSEPQAGVQNESNERSTSEISIDPHSSTPPITS